MRFTSIIMMTIAAVVLIYGNALASPTLSLNAKGEDVVILQERLVELGYSISEIDGEFGNETKNAVEQFQNDRDIEVTGIVNNATWRALRNAKAKPQKSSKPAATKSNNGNYSYDKIVILQQKLQDLGYKINIVDGDFGNVTRAALKEFQRDHNLSATGEIDNETWSAIKKVYNNIKPVSKYYTKDKILILQQKLQDLGYDITEVDGEFGNETKGALKSFQIDNKISATGAVDNATWSALQKAKPDGKGKANKSKVTITKIVPFGRPLINKKQALAVIETAKEYIGVPYVFGGTTPKGFDCSGFVQYVFKENGILLPRLADDQYQLGEDAAVSDLIAGDLVFFSTYEPGASHCGIYLGNNQFMHASSSRGVRIDSLNNAYWKPKYYGGRRIVYD